jgi:hypothetical protein
VSQLLATTPLISVRSTLSTSSCSRLAICSSTGQASATGSFLSLFSYLPSCLSCFLSWWIVLSLPNKYNEKVAAGILWGSICPQSFLLS